MASIALLDDYQNVALQMADWSALQSAHRVVSFNQRLADVDAIARALGEFEIIGIMRERTPFTREVFSRLPNLKLLVTTGKRNASIDLEAAKAHGGRGEIRFRRLWNHDRFVSGWGFVDHAVVDPGTSVGYHRHDTVQECYLILAGNGMMKVDDTVFAVAAGTAVPNRLGGAHGIAADDETVEFINVALYTEGRFDAADLGDDLSDCL